MAEADPDRPLSARPPPATLPESVGTEAGRAGPDALEIEEREMPPLARNLPAALLALLGVAVLWASLSSIDRVVTARGRLVTEATDMVLQPLEISMIRAVLVEQGQTVKAGQPLFRLDPTVTAADAAVLESQLRGLDAEIARMEAELRGEEDFVAAAPDDAGLQRSILEQRRREYAARLEGYEHQQAGLDARIAANAQAREAFAMQLEVMREVESMRVQLYESEYGSRLLALAAQSDRIDVAQRVEEARRGAEQLAAERRELEATRATFMGAWRRELSEALVERRRDRQRLGEELRKIEMRQAMVVLAAPADAIVLELAPRSVGSVVQAAEPLATLQPLNSPLEAEVEISPADVGRLRRGDAVRVKLDAFPFQRHGTLEGRLRSLSDDTFTRETAAGRQSYYRARIAVTGAPLADLPDDNRLMAGMSLTAEIKVGERTVISYLLYPLIRAFDEGLREP